MLQPTLPGTPQPESNFDRYEIPVIDKLSRALNDEESAPLLTIDESDLIIDVHEFYFDVINRIYTPRDALEQVRSGELTDKAIQQKRRAARGIVRKKKDDMYAERVMTAVYASDTCRSLYRIATGGEMIPIEDDDTPETVHNRVGDFVDDMLVAGRQTRLLKGAAMLRTTDKIREKFDTDPGARIVLTGLAGANSMKKVQLWLGELYRMSGGFNLDRISGETRSKLLKYAADRPIEFQNKFDLLQAIANLKRSSVE